jgi:hypothetical protein
MNTQISLNRQEKRRHEKITKRPIPAFKHRSIFTAETLHHMRWIKSEAKVMENFIQDILEGRRLPVEYYPEEKKDYVMITNQDGKDAHARDFFSLFFEYAYQIKRFTKSKDSEVAHNELSKALGIISAVSIIDGTSSSVEVFDEDLVYVTEVIEKTKQFLLKTDYVLFNRVYNEMLKVTTKAIDEDRAYTLEETEQWLVALGR